MSNDVKDDQLEFEVIGTNEAPKLQDWRGSLEYTLGRVKGKVAFKINRNNVTTRNKASKNKIDGVFCSDYIYLSVVEENLAGRKLDTQFPSELFINKLKGNNNNPPFIAAILRHEGLIAQFSPGSFGHKLALEVDDFEGHLLESYKSVSAL